MATRESHQLKNRRFGGANVKNILSRLQGHLGWHYRNARRLIKKRAAEVVPEHGIGRLMLRNRLSRRSVASKAGPVVSLTTYGARAKTVYLAIESIACGDVRPSRLILWLDDVRIMEALPAPLKRLQSRGLEIRLCENFGPHTKYFPYITSEPNSDAPLVTADDDVIYPASWLEDLANAFEENPRIISCQRARIVGIDHGSLMPFRTWKFCDSTDPKVGYFFEGVSGVIYPPAFLDKLRAEGKRFSEICPKHDDLWLNLIALRNAWPIRQIRRQAAHFHLIPDTQAEGLWAQNMGDAGDLQIGKVFALSDIALLESAAPELRR